MSSFPDHFSGHAKLYAQARPTYPEGLIAELAALAPGRALAWDVGTGSGQAARMLARHFDHVHATDPSAGQIAEAEAHPGVTFGVEAAEQCSLGDASCDLVLAATALHWFDHDRFFPEAKRVLRPDGVLAAIGYDWFYVDPAVDALIGARLLKPLEPYWAAQNWLLIDGYRTLPFPGAELRLSPSAIHLAWTREQLEAYVRSWSAVQKLGEQTVRPAFAELSRIWPDQEPRHVVMPMLTRAVRL